MARHMLELPTESCAGLPLSGAKGNDCERDQGNYTAYAGCGFDCHEVRQKIWDCRSLSPYRPLHRPQLIDCRIPASVTFLHLGYTGPCDVVAAREGLAWR